MLTAIARCYIVLTTLISYNYAKLSTKIYNTHKQIRLMVEKFGNLLSF